MTAKVDRPVVSVVIPVYNGEASIGETLASACEQSVRDIEILVVDDCSRDATAAIVQQHAERDRRVRYLRMPANSGGPAGPRNRGVEEARGEWIALCDADDLWDPLKLELQLACVRSHQCDLVCTGIVDFHHGDLPARPGASRGAVAHVATITLRAMLFKNRVATSSVMCRRESILRVGGFDTDRALVAVEDYDLWLRMLDTTGARMLRLDLPLVDYRRLPGSISRNKWKHARKVALATRRHFERRGRGWFYPIAAPLLMLSYSAMGLWMRVIRGRM